MISGVFAFGAGLIGLVATVCVLPGLLQGGLFRNSTTKDA